MTHLPAILRIFIIFALVLFAIRKNVALGHVFTGSAIVLGFLFGMDPVHLGVAAFHALTHPKTLALACVVSLILVLSHSMEKAKEMERLLEAFRGIIGNPRLNVVIFPALIGLLPMPGGAIFSAPMVKNIGGRFGLTPPQLSYINYWFRHIWEYWWPLYPGILLTTALAGIDLWKFVLSTLPLTAVAVFIGYRTLKFGGLREQSSSANLAHSTPLRPFLVRLIPIAIVIGGGLGLGAIFNYTMSGEIQKISRELGLIVSLCCAIAFVWIKSRFRLTECVAILTTKQLVRMFYMVCSILIFKGILQESQAAEAITRELLALHIPLISVCVVLPFLMGMITGITVAFVGTTFPIIIALVQNLGESQFLLQYLMLSLVSGFVGVMLSPVHLCLLLSNEYFQTTMPPVYRYLLMPCSVVLIFALSYFEVLRLGFAFLRS
ncbi:MAG: DUF401 family protein [Deltaproteobacteria bacterium]|nr:DUF401 family protein [Deltaproteobacteria bacterium]MBW2068568.1 DUF401 family protein [Deltaproteobacteria bacterium]